MMCLALVFGLGKLSRTFGLSESRPGNIANGNRLKERMAAGEAAFSLRRVEQDKIKVAHLVTVCWICMVTTLTWQSCHD